MLKVINFIVNVLFYIAVTIFGIITLIGLGALQSNNPSYAHIVVNELFFGIIAGGIYLVKRFINNKVKNAKKVKHENP